ncbi:transglutaminase-like domain-containing protein [Virgibacillus sp. FSP13]
MRSPINVDYFYENTLNQKVELWMVLPEKGINKSIKPNQIHRVPTGENLGYFILHKNDKLHLNFDVDWYNPKNETTTLNNEEIAYYLRNTTFSPINEEITNLAKKITKGKNSDKEKAYEIFYYIVSNYKYKYPPSSRGVISFLKAKKGDCGEFSFLFCSLCRSIGIPTRTVFGSWSDGKMNGHAWNEIFLFGDGWFPVDTSMASIQSKNYFRFLDSSIRTLSWKKYFGKTEGQRVVFSKDAETKILPPYPDSEDKTMLIEPIYINNEPFYWGQESLNGSAPYLQPAYVKFDEFFDSHSTEVKASDLLGTWKTKENGINGILASIKKRLLFPALLVMIISFLFGNLFLELIYKSSLIIVFLCFILRKERPFLFSIPLFFMILSMLSTISRLT